MGIPRDSSCLGSCQLCYLGLGSSCFLLPRQFEVSSPLKTLMLVLCMTARTWLYLLLSGRPIVRLCSIEFVLHKRDLCEWVIKFLLQFVEGENKEGLSKVLGSITCALSRIKNYSKFQPRCSSLGGIDCRASRSYRCSC